MTSADLDADPAVSVFFKIEIGGYDLGNWMSCDGLSMEVKTEPVTEGGNNGFQWQLPTRITFTNVKLTRPIGPDSKLLAEWLASMIASFRRTSCTISALTHDRKTLCSWNLKEVIPVKWSGPSFSAESPKVAQESLELAHHGFEYKDEGAWA